MTKFSCKQCNHPFEAFPLDVTYTEAYSKECVVNGSGLLSCNVIREYECQNCYDKTEIYWHQKKGHSKKLLKKALALLGDKVSTNNTDRVEYD